MRSSASWPRKRQRLKRASMSSVFPSTHARPMPRPPAFGMRRRAPIVSTRRPTRLYSSAQMTDPFGDDAGYSTLVIRLVPTQMPSLPYPAFSIHHPVSLKTGSSLSPCGPRSKAEELHLALLMRYCAGREFHIEHQAVEVVGVDHGINVLAGFFDDLAVRGHEQRALAAAFLQSPDDDGIGRIT
jgi:hypothetical protein